ncbi:MAG: hypothetical protein ACI93T_000619, partial [Porticoccaceae bacterium]
SFPPAWTVDADGKPLLSWRVLLLPYLDHKPLYDKFRLDEPWDSSHNRQLLNRMPNTYRLHTRGNSSRTMTDYVAVVGEETLWPYTESRNYDSISDGSSHTLLVAEFVGHDIPWTKPEDLHFDQMDMTADSDDGICSVLSPPAFATADGVIRFLPVGTPENIVRALLTAQGGETFDLDKLPKTRDGRLRAQKPVR